MELLRNKRRSCCRSNRLNLATKPTSMMLIRGVVLLSLLCASSTVVWANVAVSSSISSTQISTKPRRNGRSKVGWFGRSPKQTTADGDDKEGKEAGRTRRRPFSFGKDTTNDSSASKDGDGKTAVTPKKGRGNRKQEKDSDSKDDTTDHAKKGGGGLFRRQSGEEKNSDAAEGGDSTPPEKKNGGILNRFGRSRKANERHDDGIEEEGGSDDTEEEEQDSDQDGQNESDKEGDGDDDKEEEPSSPAQNTTATTEEDSSKASNTTVTDQQDRSRQDQQSMSGGLPGNVIVIGGPSSGAMGGRGGRPSPGHGFYSRGGPQMMPIQGQPQQQQPNGSSLVAAELFATIVSGLIKWSFLSWVAQQWQAREESLHPTQHFVWECINDRFSRDATAFSNAIAKPPAEVTSSASSSPYSASLLDSNNNLQSNSGGLKNLPFGVGNTATGLLSRRSWSQHVRNLERRRQIKLEAEPSASYSNKTVVVVDCHPTHGGSEETGGEFDLKYLTNVVSFLLHQYHAHVLGDDPEIILLVASPGGAVTTYGLAASQIQRLAMAGITTTACVDKVAASGGYMVASQATKILAAPFATLGSIGVFMETLNFNQLLTKYGVRPLSLKAGKSKNVLSPFGNITEEDIDSEVKQIEQVHEEFIDLCFQKRPQLQRSVCDGRVLTGLQALEVGMIDGITTSDDYIWEQIQSGHRVLMVHKSHASLFPRRRLISAIDLLPHFNNMPSMANLVAWQNRAVKWFTNTLSDRHRVERLLQRAIQAGCFVSMVAPKVFNIFSRSTDRGYGNY